MDYFIKTQSSETALPSHPSDIVKCIALILFKKQLTIVQIPV